jgi:hypothetical protein
MENANTVSRTVYMVLLAERSFLLPGYGVRLIHTVTSERKKESSAMAAVHHPFSPTLPSSAVCVRGGMFFCVSFEALAVVSF